MDAFSVVKPMTCGPSSNMDNLNPTEGSSSELKPLKHPAIPLRQRPLPASFWQEPNHQLISRSGDPFPTFPDSVFQRCLMEQMLSYKLFLEKMQTAPVSLPPFSRYPFTEYLYQNYGLKNRTNLPPLKPPIPVQNLRPPFISPLLPTTHFDSPKLSALTFPSATLVKPIATKSPSIPRPCHRYHPFLAPK